MAVKGAGRPGEEFTAAASGGAAPRAPRASDRPHREGIGSLAAAHAGAAGAGAAGAGAAGGDVTAAGLAAARPGFSGGIHLPLLMRESALASTSRRWGVLRPGRGGVAAGSRMSRTRRRRWPTAPGASPSPARSCGRTARSGCCSNELVVRGGHRLAGRVDADLLPVDAPRRGPSWTGCQPRPAEGDGGCVTSAETSWRAAAPRAHRLPHRCPRARRGQGGGRHRHAPGGRRGRVRGKHRRRSEAEALERSPRSPPAAGAGRDPGRGRRLRRWRWRWRWVSLAWDRPGQQVLRRPRPAPPPGDPAQRRVT